jgi:hypothetical protein
MHHNKNVSSLYELCKFARKKQFERSQIRKRLKIRDHLIQNLIISLLPGQNYYNDPNERISPHVDKKSLKIPKG